MVAEASSRSDTSSWSVATLIVAVTLGTGILELPMALLRLALFARPIEGNAHIVWMAALTNLVLSLPIGLMLWLIARRWPGDRSERVATIVLFTLAVWALLLYLDRVHFWALFVLAMGIAVIASQRMLRDRMKFRRVVRRLALLLPPLLILEGLAAAAWTGARERMTLRGLPAPSAEAPNVLFLMLDTVRSISMSLYGYALRTTPFLEELAASGTVFQQALVTAPWTLPSHAGMFTGRYPYELNAGFKTSLNGVHPTLAEVLARNGYATAAFSANRMYVSYEHGLDRGFARFEDYRVSPGQIAVSSSLGRRLVWQPWFQNLIGYYDLYGRKNAALVNRSLLRWLERRDPQRPFFAFVNYYDAHHPYLPPAPFARRFTNDTTAYRPNDIVQALTPAQIARERAAYEGAIAYLDQQIQLIIRELDTRDLLANTLVIIASDHGEQFGEHGFMDHGNSLYRALNEVPLLVRWPGHVPAGHRVAEGVTLRDLPATVLDLVGIRTAELPGASLRQWWETNQKNPAQASPLLAQLTSPNGRMAHAIRLDSLQYVDWFGRVEGLYDLKADPAETVNLMSRPDSALLVQPFRLLRDSLGGHGRKPEVNKLRRRLSRLVL